MRFCCRTHWLLNSNNQVLYIHICKALTNSKRWQRHRGVEGPGVVLELSHKMAVTEAAYTSFTMRIWKARDTALLRGAIGILGTHTSGCVEGSCRDELLRHLLGFAIRLITSTRFIHQRCHGGIHQLIYGRFCIFYIWRVLFILLICCVNTGEYKTGFQLQRPKLTHATGGAGSMSSGWTTVHVGAVGPLGSMALKGSRYYIVLRSDDLQARTLEKVLPDTLCSVVLL